MYYLFHLGYAVTVLLALWTKASDARIFFGVLIPLLLTGGKHFYMYVKRYSNGTVFWKASVWLVQSFVSSVAIAYSLPKDDLFLGIFMPLVVLGCFLPVLFIEMGSVTAHLIVRAVVVKQPIPSVKRYVPPYPYPMPYPLSPYPPYSAYSPPPPYPYHTPYPPYAYPLPPQKEGQKQDASPACAMEPDGQRKGQAADSSE